MNLARGIRRSAAAVLFGLALLRAGIGSAEPPMDPATLQLLADYQQILLSDQTQTVQQMAALRFDHVLDYSSLQADHDYAQRRATIDQLASSGRHVLFDDGRFQVWSPIGA